MKPFEQQTYYELLEIPVTAPVDDIRAAYSRLMELYAPDSIAVYALVEPEQVDSLRARMTEAVEILTDADLRAEYDKDLGLPVRRMVDAVAAGGKPSTEATPGTDTVARAAEALTSTASVGASVGEGAQASARKEPEQGTASTSTPPPAEPATTPGDFRASFFRGFSFAYVSSSLQDTRLVGSAVDVPSVAPATSGAEARTDSTGGSGPAAVPVQAGEGAPSEAAPLAVRDEPAASAPGTTAPVTPEQPAQAASSTPAPVVPATTTTESPRAPEQANSALANAPARPEATPAKVPTSAPGARPVPPPLPSARAAASGAPAQATSPQQSAGTASGAPAQAPQPAEQGRPTPRSATGRQLGEAQVIAQDSAIATAESALAQVAARVREPQARPRPPDIPADAEFNGELLRRVREARGQSLQQVADRTRITKSHLENVEADRYSALPPPVYLRGILMNLARELGLDPLRVSRSYLALASEKSGKK